MHIDRCRFCNSQNLTKFIDLGEMPLVNNLLDFKNQDHGKYPLKVYRCNTCTMAQLDYVVDPEILFGHYLYRSGMSKGFIDHCFQLGSEIQEMFTYRSDVPFVVDIASNDGTFLKQLNRYDRPLRVLGVEPAKNLAVLAALDGVPTRNAFFNYQTAMDVVLKEGKADVITAQNVFAHVHDINGFMHGVKYLLKDDGVFIVEAPWLGDLINDASFDTVYHEHLSYISVTGMNAFAKKHNMHIHKIKYFKYMHAGTIRYYIKKNEGITDISNQWEIENAIYRESHINAKEFDCYGKFVQERIESIRETLINYISRTPMMKIAGIGAAAKSTILCNFCGLENVVEKIYDNTPEKQGKFQPGTRIPIVPFHEIKNETKPMLIMPWNVKDEIIKNVRSVNPNAKFIVAVPKFEVI